MAFERNDIVNKNRLMGELGEELMGYEHNDIVTVDVMNEAIAEGGGGGGGGDFKTLTMTVVLDDADWGGFSVYPQSNDDGGQYCTIYDADASFVGYAFVDSTVGKEFTVVYTGDSAILYAYNVITDFSGDATVDGIDITATGDFTITGYMDD